jgi:hypothetical protein
LKFPVTMADLDTYIGSKLALVNMAWTQLLWCDNAFPPKDTLS